MKITKSIIIILLATAAGNQLSAQVRQRILPDTTVMIDKEKVEQCNEMVNRINAMDLRCEMPGVISDGQPVFRTETICFDEAGRLRKYFLNDEMADGARDAIYFIRAFYDEKGDLVHLYSRTNGKCEEHYEMYWVNEGEIIDFNCYYNYKDCGRGLSEAEINLIRPVISNPLTKSIIFDWTFKHLLHAETLLAECTAVKPNQKPKNQDYIVASETVLDENLTLYFPTYSKESIKYPEGAYYQNFWEAIYPEDSVSEFTNHWFSRYLDRMGEPVLYNKTNQAQNIVRYSNFGAWSSPFICRIEQDGANYSVTYNITKGHGNIGDSRIKIDPGSEKINAKKWNKVIAKMEAIDFWNKSTHDTIYILDGAEWVLEAFINGRYHLVMRNSPFDYDRKEEKQYGKLCNMLIQIYLDANKKKRGKFLFFKKNWKKVRNE